VRGRWYGVRGRRFVRPSLILAADGGDSRRVLAELDDKPWAAEDGEPWRATFRLGGELPDGRLELTVAPDITVTLRPVPDGGGRLLAGAVAAPAAASAGRGRSGVRAPDPERLTARLTALESTLERERARRADAEASLDEHRDQTRRTVAEVGRLRAELELARAAEVDARDTAALLDATRRDHHELKRRHDALAAEHERARRDVTAVRERLAARESELIALRAERETARREPAAERRTVAAATEPHADRAVPGPGAPRTETPRAAAPAGSAHVHQPPPPRSARPVNPSLRSHSWLLRLGAVIVLALVLLAVYVVLKSTVL
jgi:hypothetical protein